jgi:hypothetical protein
VKKNELNIPNLGVFISKIPDNLLKKLKTECLDFLKKEKMISGITANKVPEHYYLENNNKELFDFLHIYIKKYYEKYNYSKYYKVLNKNSPLVFGKPWFNIQKKGEFIPYHTHDGILSYSIWIQIPNLKNDDKKFKWDSCFELLYHDITGFTDSYMLPLDKSYEGKFLFFPSSLKHCVYPFFDNDELRISISGNILYDN